MTAGYILTAGAEADVREIVRYTRKQWGNEQARRYLVRLDRGIAHLAAGQGTFKALSDLHPALRVSRCERHYIFCLYLLPASRGSTGADRGDLPRAHGFDGAVDRPAGMICAEGQSLAIRRSNSTRVSGYPSGFQMVYPDCGWPR